MVVQKKKIIYETPATSKSMFEVKFHFFFKIEQKWK